MGARTKLVRTLWESDWELWTQVVFQVETGFAGERQEERLHLLFEDWQVWKVGGQTGQVQINHTFARQLVYTRAE